MNDLIHISNGEISGVAVQTVNARELHAFLAVGKDFTNWIKDRIEAYGFAEGRDFTTGESLSTPDLASAKARPQMRKDYHLTLDMAKELAMVERNEKGKQARQYFIECERQAKSVVPALPNFGMTTSLPKSRKCWGKRWPLNFQESSKNQCRASARRLSRKGAESAWNR